MNKFQYKKEEEKITAKEIIICMLFSLLIALLFVTAVCYHNTKHQGAYIANPDRNAKIHYIYEE